MKLSLKREKGKFGMKVLNQEGQSISFDANPGIGGEGFGVRPMEAVASSLAACASIDVLLILEKQKVVVENYGVEIKASRVESVPALFTNIDLEFSFTCNASEDKLKRAVDLSMEKYCSVSKILEPTCRIEYSVRLSD